MIFVKMFGRFLDGLSSWPGLKLPLLKKTGDLLERGGRI